MSFLGNALINLVLRGVPFAPPAHLFLALFTSSGEVVGGNYSRVEVTGKWAPPDANDMTFNTELLSFPNPTTPWGTLTGGGLYDEPTGGNLLVGGPVATPVNVPANTPVYFNPQTLRFSLSPRTI